MESAEFHSLTVASVEPLTDDSVAVTFEVPDDLLSAYTHTPGQHLIMRATIDGEDVRRSYSICSPAGTASPRVGIKQLSGGAFSSFANDVLKAGDSLEVTPPKGEFTLAPSASNRNHYVAFAAGSGITPVISMIASVLEFEPQSMFTLIYGNKDGRSVMFLDDLDALKGTYADRFVLLHILTRESHTIPLLEGRIDESKVEQLLGTVVDPDTVDSWYLCGPRGMVDAVRSSLEGRGIAADTIHDELFFAGDVDEIEVAEDDVVGSTVRFTLDGRTSTAIVASDGAPILDHVLAIRPEGPFSCRSGACASCRARVTEGEVRMDRNWSLSAEEVASGQILTCQSHPVSDVVELTYDV
jgi:ring-1,2-phenylacetyl-CoA epoxidase subunit PaaE